MFRPPLDQGRTGTCVAHAWATWGWAGPIIERRRVLALRPYDFYRELVLLDEWPENDREAHAPDAHLQFGSSVRAGAKAARARGWLDSFGWATTADEVVRWLSNVGPVVVGTLWLPSMSEPDKQGVVRVNRGQRPLGGHSYAFTGYNHRQGLLRSPNSWGRGGEFWIPAEDFDWLLSQDGEACTAVETRG